MPTKSARPSSFPSHLPGWGEWLSGLSPVLMLVSGAVFLGVCLYIVQAWQNKKPAQDYSSADVVYGEAVHATHMMTGEPAGMSPARPSTSVGHNPLIVMPDEFLDFGTVPSGQVVSKVIPIMNRGDSALIIHHAQTTCGCTVADITAREIPPGKVALLTITFDTKYHDLKGQTVRRGVIIETNDPLNQTSEVWFQATIR